MPKQKQNPPHPERQKRQHVVFGLEPEEGLVQSHFEKLSTLYAAAAEAGRLMLLMGVYAMRLKASLRHGEFIPALKEHCPEITPRSVQRAMQASRRLMESLDFNVHAPNRIDHFNRMELALTGEAEPDLRAEIDSLIEGVSGRQLVLGIQNDREAANPSLEPEAEDFCLNHFESHPNGSEDEESWRDGAEAGEMTWQQCKQRIEGRLTGFNPVTGEARRPPANSFKLAATGLKRFQWLTPEHWKAFKQEERETLLAALEEAIRQADPEVKFRTMQAAQTGEIKPAKSRA
ncbi:MAG: hypothetical protein V4726_11150 [Verrucomicrobiota bacterium]